LNLRDKVAELGFDLDWDLPVPYSQFNPVSAEINDDDYKPNGAGKAWLYVEPDGDVLPAQGITKKLGNFLADPWEVIWENAKQYNKN
jgi:MoaA/NifB/PqqE/SkfB family radical SAM enzyme